MTQLVVSPGAVSTTTPNAEGNAAAVGFTTKSFTYSYTAATTGTTYDVANFANVKVQITTQYAISGGSSTVTFQTSNDGTNWYSQTLVAATGSQSSSTSSTSSAGIIYVGNLAGRYFRDKCHRNLCIRNSSRHNYILNSTIRTYALSVHQSV
jgi:streptogramin lyase